MTDVLKWHVLAAAARWIHTIVTRGEAEEAVEIVIALIMAAWRLPAHVSSESFKTSVAFEESKLQVGCGSVLIVTGSGSSGTKVLRPRYRLRSSS